MQGLILVSLRFVVHMNALKHIGIGRVNRGKYRDLGLKVLCLILKALRFGVQKYALWHLKALLIFIKPREFC